MINHNEIDPAHFFCADENIIIQGGKSCRIASSLAVAISPESITDVCGITTDNGGGVDVVPVPVWDAKISSTDRVCVANIMTSAGKLINVLGKTVGEYNRKLVCVGFTSKLRILCVPWKAAPNCDFVVVSVDSTMNTVIINIEEDLREEPRSKNKAGDHLEKGQQTCWYILKLS